MLSKVIDIPDGSCIMGPSKQLENKMKKVSIGEKAFIIGICSLIGGISCVLSATTLLGAFLIGLGFGVLGAVIIGLLHRSRS